VDVVVQAKAVSVEAVLENPVFVKPVLVILMQMVIGCMVKPSQVPLHHDLVIGLVEASWVPLHH
jgi:hypothetical protein